MKKNYIIKYIILVLLIIMISLCLFYNNKKNRENYFQSPALTELVSLNNKNTRPSL